MSPVPTTIVERLQLLSPEKQELVLEMVTLLEQEQWQRFYESKFAEFRQAVQVIPEAAARGEVASIPKDGNHQLRQQLRSLRERVKASAIPALTIDQIDEELSEQRDRLRDLEA
jgi:hypothetical protein